MAERIQSFKEFYPYYLSEHEDRTCRRLHFIGSTLVLICLVLAFTHSWLFALAMPFCGYGFAWVGHFVFEKNKPATFKYPLWSFMGDWVMYKDILAGKLKA